MPLGDIRRGLKEKSWWEHNANQSAYNVSGIGTGASTGSGASNNASTTVLRYIIREISTPNDGSHIYEIVSFAADENGKYQNVSRQYKILRSANQ